MKTRITELFGIKYPILLSGMSFVSKPELVAAVSNAGGLGILATGTLNADQTREYIKKIRSLTDKPFGANATLLFPGAYENAKVILEEKVPVINFALGKGDWIVKEAATYGGKVIATVVNSRHAKRAQEYGCDAVIATGHEAAAHGGDVTTMLLVPRLSQLLDIPVIAAGGIGDGRGLAAALALGAEGVAMGTRFASTAESPVHDSTKQMTIKKDVTETFYTNRFDGVPARVMDTPGARKAMRRRVGLWSAFLNSFAIAKEMQVPYYKLFLQTMKAGLKTTMQLAYLAKGFRGFRLSTVEGDLDEGVYPIGQVMGLVQDVPTTAELIERIVAEAKQANSALAKKLAD
ncbi:MAG: nitronate monooxygenase [Candidatus Alcyoniella australis]|nr:nitronate monooxygenase [Candidatus Alcyoniella australis]